jgi:hypothetical protein
MEIHVLINQEDSAAVEVLNFSNRIDKYIKIKFTYRMVNR